MSPLKLNSRGVTLPELLVVMIASSVLIVTLFLFTSDTINSFMRLQAEGLAHSKLAEGSFRVSRVLRGVDYIETANTDSVTAYTYFAPQDLYTSRVSYYLNPAQDQLLADVVPMTADYPVGSLIPAQQKTVVIIDNFYKIAGSPTFKYYNANFNELTAPVSDLQAIKNISVNLHTKFYESNNQDYASSEVTVNLRNRKTNL
jgi:prepilin-type N-terminal cleavage/methylation domain-containing protein